MTCIAAWEREGPGPGRGRPPLQPSLRSLLGKVRQPSGSSPVFETSQKQLLSHFFFFFNPGKPPVNSETWQERRFNPRALKESDECAGFVLITKRRTETRRAAGAQAGAAGPGASSACATDGTRELGRVTSPLPASAFSSVT